MFCVFGTNINWEIVSKNFEGFSNYKIFAYTDRPPNKPLGTSSNYVWEKLNYIMPEEDYENQTCEDGYIKHCLEKVEELRKRDENKSGKVIYIFENTLYFDFSKKIIFSEELKFSSEKNTDSLRIISDTHVKIKNRIITLYELDSSTRKKLFEKLYTTKVFDYDNVILPEIKENSKIFFIVSVIHVQKKGRSVFTDSERYNQTLAQIQSIKDKVENSVIFVLETSSLSFTEMKGLSENAFVILHDKHDTVSYYANVCPNKNITELILLQITLPLFDNINFSHWCKFSSRRFFTDNFDKKDFFSASPTFRKIKKSWDGNSVYESILFSFPKKYSRVFQEKIKDMIYIIESQNTDVEHTFYNFFRNEPINEVNKLGLSGNYAAGQINLV